MSKLGAYATLYVVLATLLGALLIIGAPGLFIYYRRKWTAIHGDKK